MNDLQNFLAIMSNGDDKFSSERDESDTDPYPCKFVDFNINDDGGDSTIFMRAVFDIDGRFQYFNGASRNNE